MASGARPKWRAYAGLAYTRVPVGAGERDELALLLDQRAVLPFALGERLLEARARAQGEEHLRQGQHGEDEQRGDGDHEQALHALDTGRDLAHEAIAIGAHVLDHGVDLRAQVQHVVQALAAGHARHRELVPAIGLQPHGVGELGELGGDGLARGGGLGGELRAAVGGNVERREQLGQAGERLAVGRQIADVAGQEVAALARLRIDDREHHGLQPAQLDGHLDLPRLRGHRGLGLRHELHRDGDEAREGQEQRREGQPQRDRALRTGRVRGRLVEHCPASLRLASTPCDVFEDECRRVAPAEAGHQGSSRAGRRWPRPPGGGHSPAGRAASCGANAGSGLKT